MTRNTQEIQPQKLYEILFFLFVTAIILNLDRILLGDAASLRRNDVADIYIDKFQYGGQFWRHPLDYAWNASLMRGWPIYLGSVQPQHLCCLLSSFLSASVSFTIFQVLLDTFTLTGTYMFFYNFLGYRHLSALYGSIFNLSLFYWFNENPYVILVPLLPLIIALLSVGKRGISKWIRFLFLVPMILMMYPPYTLPMLPLLHLAGVYFLSDRNTKTKNIVLAVLFWTIFTIFYSPNLIAIASNWPHSNRPLWALVPPVFRFSSFIAFLRHKEIIAPCLCAIALFDFWKKPKIWVLGAVALIVTFMISQSVLLSGIPFFNMFSFAWGRSFYFMGFNDCLFN